MPHISKDKSDPKLLRLIFSELSTLIAHANKKTAPAFLQELLTETEQIMLAKRLAAVVMLSQKIGVYKIATRLHLSTSTVKRLSLAQEYGDYDNIIRSITQNKEKAERFWEIIELISRGGMPSMSHKDRWKFLDKT